MLPVMTTADRQLTIAAIALDAHIKSKKQSSYGWAREHGFNPRTVQKWVAGEVLPQAKTLMRINKAAEGTVPPSHWSTVVVRD